jgi:hypothetical protein
MSVLAARKELLLRLWYAVGSLLFIALLIRGVPIIADALHEKPWDGIVDLTVAKAWWAGTDPYTVEALKAAKLPTIGHPPTTAFWFLPLAGIDKGELSWTLALLFLSAFFIQTYLMAKELELPTPMLWAGLLVAWSLNTTWMRYHLYLAQISELIGFLFVLAWLALRRRWDVLGGVALGSAFTLKLFPGLLLLYLFIERRWRVIFAAAATWILVAVVMTSRLGVATWREFAQQEPEIFIFWIGHTHNAALQSMIQRWVFAPMCGWTRTYNRASTVIAGIIVLALFAGIHLLTRRRRDNKTLFDLGYWAVALLAVIANPFAFEHYSILYWPAATIVAWQVWELYKRRPLGRRGQICAIIGAAVVVGCFWMLSVSMYNQDAARDAWRMTHHGHWKAHAYEACYWLPPWLLGATCMLFAWRARRVE